MIPYCKAHGIGLIPWGPLQGDDLAESAEEFLTRKESSKGTPFEKKFSDAGKAIIGRFDELAKGRD
jgi:aryl-alcohol dehydrogenase-like predicted oxidoreductase